MKTSNTLELAEVYPSAFEALPEPYQADSCLLFWDEDGKVFTRPLDDQEHILGVWKCVFNPETKRWDEC